MMLSIQLTGLALWLAAFALSVESLSLEDFADPPSTARPKVRYWIKDAYAFDPEVAHYDLSAMKRAGFGGAELLQFADYHGKTISDPAYYAIGSGNWSRVFESVVNSAVGVGLHLDFCVGASSGGAGSTSFNPRTDPDLLKGVVYGYKYFDAGASYDGPLPDIDTSEFGDYSGGNFVSAVLGRLTSDDDSGTGPQTLVLSSTTDLTDKIDCLPPKTASSDCSVSFTTPEEEGKYVLISFWTLGAASLEAPGGFDGPNRLFPASAGLYFTDHFADSGADATAAFFRDSVLTDAIKDQLGKLPKPVYAWQDSLEFERVGREWGIDMLDRWKSKRPYGPGLALPSLFVNKWQYDDTSASEKMLNDYKYVLTDGYRSYSHAMTNWSNSLGIQYSQQPYGWKAPSMDIAGVAGSVDAPETESLDFQNNIDGMRHMSGGVHTPTSGSVFSEELGARESGQYQITWPEILNQVLPGMAAGVNMMVLHGYSYSGYYPQTTWPGYTAFGTAYGQSWGPRDPEWNYSKPIVDFISRNFLIAQTGKMKLDLAFWSWNAMDKNGTDRGSFVNAGYSYEYISTVSLEHENNFVSDGKLNPDNAGYRALVFPELLAIETSGIEKVLSFAKQGFPMVFYGTTPKTSTNWVEGGDEFVQTTMDSLLGLDNVLYVDTEADAIEALAGLGVNPTTAFSTPTAWYSVHRYADGTDLFWLFNSNSEEQTMDVTFDVAGTPMLLDAWTGEITPVSVYREGNLSTTIPVTLPGNSSAIYGFGEELSSAVQLPSRHIESTDVSFPTVKDGKIVLRETQNATRQVTYNGENPMKVDFTAPTPIYLTDWELTITSFNAPDNITEADPFYNSVLETSSWQTHSLVPWQEIDEALENVSGTGTYVSQFSNDGNAAGAFLNLTGDIFDTVSVSINGVQAPPVNIRKPILDISDFMKDGMNEVKITVSTTLINVVSSVASEVHIESAADDGSGYAKAEKQDYGLVGDVIVNFYQVVQAEG